MKFSINNRPIGPGHPTYIIAELSCNHLQNYDLAVELVHAAHRAGADAVKLQTYTPDTITLNCDNEYFKINGTIWEGNNLYNLYQQTMTPWEWTPKLKALANSLGMDLFSSPFDLTAVDYLESVGVPCYKVASFEIVDHILLKKVAQTGKPIIMSTGMASLSDISSAVNVLRENGCQELALLKCTSSYPADPADANLANIPNLSQTFDVVVGISDHTLGSEVPIVGVSLGACIIEKHFILNRTTNTTNPTNTTNSSTAHSEDEEFSMTEAEFTSMVKSVRIAEKTIGKITYGGVSSEQNTKILRRSLFVVEDMTAGELFTENNVRSIRPGHGLHTRHYEDVLGQTARSNIKRGTPLAWSLIN